MQGASFPPPSQPSQHSLPQAQDDLSFAFPQVPAIPLSTTPAPHGSSDNEKALMRRVEELTKALESAREAQVCASWGMLAMSLTGSVECCWPRVEKTGGGELAAQDEGWTSSGWLRAGGLLR
eukprot:768292-Hanusia_phi.AAC.8